jgi:hypothetical protein
MGIDLIKIKKNIKGAALKAFPGNVPAVVEVGMEALPTLSR